MQLVNNLGAERWHYRGVLDNWNLKTSIERAAEDWHIDLKELPNLEKQLILEFKRACHLSANLQLPNPDDTLGWLALMQHHGTPTRLLDLTYSPFVAAYFALDALLSSPEPRPNAA
ncbi:MAG TPA: FRG domain-containing protein, partial [Candidatus Angelobacter sp.]